MTKMTNPNLTPTDPIPGQPRAELTPEPPKKSKVKYIVLGLIVLTTLIVVAASI